MESVGHADAGRECSSESKTSGNAGGGAEELADEMDKRYEPGARESVTVPGTGGTIAGTAFADHVAEMSDERAERLDKQFSDFQAADDDSGLES